jgi:hypothetical protein
LLVGATIDGKQASGVGVEHGSVPGRQQGSLGSEGQRLGAPIGRDQMLEDSRCLSVE